MDFKRIHSSPNKAAPMPAAGCLPAPCSSRSSASPASQPGSWQPRKLLEAGRSQAAAPDKTPQDPVCSELIRND